jgi:outer membrane protein TolC
MYLWLLFPLICWSNTPETRRLIDEALLRAPQLMTFAENMNAHTNLVSQSKLIANPILTYQTGRLKSGAYNGSVHDVTLNQPFPWPGRRSSRIKTQEFLLKISTLEVEEAKLALAHQIYLLCAEFSALGEMEKHHKERRERFSLVHKYLSSRPLASPKLQVERDLIEAQIKLVERTMLDLSMRKLQALNEISILTGIEAPKVTFNWKKLSAMPEKSTYLSMIDNNPSLRKQAIRKNISANKIEEARYEARPDIMLGVNYRQENVVPVNHFYHAQVSVAIPIIDHGQHSMEAARAVLRRTEAEGRVEMNSVRLEIEHSYNGLFVARKASELFPLESLHHLETKFDKAELAFRRGQIDAMTFVQTDVQVHEIFDQLFGSRLDYYTQLSRLSALVGKGPEL